MRYKPLLLALLLCFTAPSFAAADTAKSKAPTAKKAASDKKPTAKKEAEKAAPHKDGGSGKNTAKGRNADKAKDKNESKAADKPKSESKKDNAANAADRKKTSAAETKKAARDNGLVKKENAKSKTAGTDKKDHTVPKANKEKAADEKKKNDKKAESEKPNKDKKSELGKKAKENTRKEALKTESLKTKVQTGKDKKAAAPSSDSDDLRAAVSAATADLEEKQALQKRTAVFLIRVNGSLRELQQTRSSLAGINRQQRDAWNRLQQLDTDLTRLKTEVANTRAQISRFVSGNYKNSQPNAVALFLKNAEPGQKTRFLRYTRYINTANEKVVRDLSKQQKELAAQENKINNELGRLKKLQANAQAALKKQGAKNTPEQVESHRQNAAMAKDAKKAVSRKDNEQRLNNLLKGLDKQKAEQQKKEAEARKKAAEARLAAAEKNRKANEKKAAEQRAALSNLTAEDMKLQAPAAAFVPIGNTNSFSRMQGRLKKPVNGILSGLFGQSRDNGDVWKGVFYSTPPSAVNSIASGKVVYADTLEGYGNVVVVDHGDNYVSIYSGLSEIGVARGYNVGEGHKIGTSGALPDGEEGLYLEIRYNGQNMNPLSWIN